LNALGIVVHTQLVLCPGINDTDDLHATVSDLLTRFPMVRSLSAVPVGLTKVRTERTASAKNPLRRFKPDEAARVIRELRPYQRSNTAAHGEPIVYLSDEFYLLAGKPVPGRRHYMDLSQLENGVGMVRVMLDTWRSLKKRLPEALPLPRHLTLACGTLIHAVLAGIVADLNGIANLRVDLFAVDNQLFGSEVTVSGLIAGEDLIATLSGELLGELIVLPKVMFDRSGVITLDDLTVAQLQERIGRPIAMVDGIQDLERLIA
jgi:putative radical SAM enzyme (TIGR03279 family)